MTNSSKIRCAIYTRKSSEEGLDQEFNSLDAQREACSAYIASQRHEGWKEIAKSYDDGGLSGGTLERPALQQLLADIDAGRIGMVVVYKIDRLTRSLNDFVRLVERLDAAGCSFVSVTQAFNTSSSMGRLTLNVLLSFAQFEREVTAERIRDKIAASKKKGLWMGGALPLGYDRHPDPSRQELVVNQEEAKTVVAIFELYDRLANLSLTCKEATKQGLRSKKRVYRTGRTSGDSALSRGQIHFLLRNPVYRGLIRHRDKTWPGRHSAIIDEALWTRVQTKLERAPRLRGRNGKDGLETERAAAPLIGKVYDETGDRMTPTHTQKNGRRHYYYVSNRLISGGPDPTAWRLPARTIEVAIAEAVASHLKAHASSQHLLDSPDARHALMLGDNTARLVNRLRTEAASILPDLVERVEISAKTLNVRINAKRVAAHLEIEPAALSGDALAFKAPFQIRRRGIETKVISGEKAPKPDKTLIRTLADAHTWRTLLSQGVGVSEIAKRTGHSGAFIRTRTQLAFLAPKIQMAILEGTQPEDLTLKKIVRRPIPLDWDKQVKQYGF